MRYAAETLISLRPGHLRDAYRQASFRGFSLFFLLAHSDPPCMFDHLLSPTSSAH